MNCQNLANDRQIPEKLLPFFQNADDGVREEDYIAVIDALESKYSVFGPYYDLLKTTAQAVLNDPPLRAWTDALVASVPVLAGGEIKELLPPCADAYPYYTLLVLALSLPFGISEFQRRGFSDEEILKTLTPTVHARVGLSEERNGVPGLERGGFSWMLNYAKGLIFAAGIFNITPQILYEQGMLLKKRGAEEYAVIVLSGRFHRSGYQLGSVGCTDEEGAFDADFRETEDAFIGRAVAEDARVLPELRVYPKSEWAEVVRQGGGIVGIHIPYGAALTKENIEESFAAAFRICRERYPEADVRAVHCASWMMSPQLADLAGADSKLAGFGKHFLRYTLGGNGAAVYSFVFNRDHVNDLSELPEKTTLQRKIKNMYMDGGCLYLAGGFVPKKELMIVEE